MTIADLMQQIDETERLIAVKGVHIVEYNEAALSEVAHHVVALANAEDLPAHGEAVAIRFPHAQQEQHEQHEHRGDLGSQYPEFRGEAAA